MKLRGVAAVAVGLLLLAVVVAAVILARTPSEAGRQPGPGAERRPPPAQARPNIVLIMLDDMRDDELRFMPQTRRLVGAAGARFVNSFSPNPLCCPARASSLTGLYSHNHRVYDVYPPYGFRSFDDSSTLATWLHDAGYATIYLGKYLNLYGEQPEPGAVSGGSVSYVPPGWDDWRASIDGGLPPTHPQEGSTYDYFDTTLTVNGERFENHEGDYQTRVYGDITTEVIRSRSGSEQPFFLHVSYTAPHNGAPVEPDDPGSVLRDDGVPHRYGTPARPAGVVGRFDDAITAAPGAGWTDPDFTDKPSYLQRPPLNAVERRALLAVARQRAEALWVVDRQVRRTVDALRATGALDRTLVMVTSDNGFYLGEQRRDGKVWPHEPSIRVPMLLRGPGIPVGTTRTDPFTSIDIAPTLADAAGVEPRLTVDGVSLLDVARRGDQGWTRAVLTESHPHEGVVRDTDEAGGPLTSGVVPDVRYALGVRTPRYLYVDLADGTEELYDLRRDPEQYVNLAATSAYAQVLGVHRSLLADLRACVGAACRRPLPPLPEPQD